MDYKVLYRKYRPNDFSSIMGQDYMVSILKNSIKNDKISHAYIFSGPRGTGKTSSAKVFAKAINCLNITEDGPCNNCINCLHFKENSDIIEIDAASNNGVDEIREIINNIKIAPAYSKYKVYIIDEVHMLSTNAFNALLLTLEEPPKHVVFILATTNIEAVPITVLSRCQRFDFKKISIEDIIKRLKYVVENEKIDITIEALEEIAYISDGGLRDALSMLDQLSGNNQKVTLDEVVQHFGAVSKKQVSNLYESILNNNIEKFLEIMNNFKKLSVDYKLLIKKMLEKLEEQAILSKDSYNYTGISYDIIKEIAFELAAISNYINVNINPYLLMEITLLKYFNKNTINFSNKESEKIELSTDKIISREIILNEEKEKNEQKQLEVLKIRINNCFVNAKKEYLHLIKNNWSEFIGNLTDKMLLNLLIDTNIVAASDKIVILTDNSESTVNLINKNLEQISIAYNNFLGKDYKFVSLTESDWLKEKKIYIDNIKNKIIYKYIAEDQNESCEETCNNEIEKIAYNIFDKEKIIID